VALHDRPPVTRQLHYNPHLQFGTAYETWRQGVQDGGAYCGQIRQDQLSAEGADAVLGRLLAHKLRPARRRPRAPRGLIVEIPAVKARCRAMNRPEGIERRRWRRMLTWSWRAAARPVQEAILAARGRCRCRSVTRPARVSPGRKR
jgi:hypothetical protein